MDWLRDGLRFGGEVAMSRAHAPGAVFYSFPDMAPWEERSWVWWSAPMEFPRVGVDWRQVTRLMNVTLTPVVVTPCQCPICRGIALGFGRVAVAGDVESAVAPDTINALLDLARSDRRGDFDWLAGASGVAPEKYAELWAGTRKRLGLLTP